jgi:hypothetical protein
MSSLFPHPPPVNILDCTGVLRELANLGAGTGSFKTCMATFDLRHYYHQIEPSEKTKTWFHVVCDNVTYQSERLVMGWSWSCFIAQSVSWSLVLFRRDEMEEELFDLNALQHSTTLPKMIPFVNKTGFVCILYDSFLFAGTCENTLRQVTARFRRNAADLSFTIKPGSETFFNASDMRGRKLKRERESAHEDVEYAKHLGMEIRKAPRGNFLEWRVEQSKIVAWATTPIPDTRCTLAKRIGRIIWAHQLRLCSLGAISSILRVASTLGSEVGTQYARWKESLT